jgi:hypothetical protein
VIPTVSSPRGAPAKRWRAFILLSLMILPAACVLEHARTEVADRLEFDRASARVHVKPPRGAPDVTQESIDLALVMYGIEVPAGADHPVLDARLKDRGLTSRMAFAEKATVAIGPAAFTSWALLGSTLAHELEVHCHQNFFFIYVMDAVGLDGTGEAERQAYVHELRNAKRFGLDVVDSELIADTMEYYYPDDPHARPTVPRRMRAWLARNFLKGQRGF